MTDNQEKVIEPSNVVELPDDIKPEDFPDLLEKTLITFNDGDVIEGTIVRIDRNEVMVDVGYKSEGVIPSRELSVRKSVNPKDLVNEGDRIQALVLDKEDDEGRLILSVKRAIYEKAWGDIQEISDNDKSVKGTVIESVKGGLIVDIGVRGFLPASLIDVRRVKELTSYIGEEIEAKILELDRQRNNIVLSRKAHLEQEQSGERKSFLENLEVGNIKEGKISSIVNFGAFVDIGGMDGLVHVSELSWRHVENPNEVVKVGDTVTVKVLEIDNDKERISLSIKQVTEDPWSDFELQYKQDDIVDGEVTKVVPFGAFVTIGKGVEGLVHVSEISVDKVDSPELALAIGQKVKIKITELDIPKRRVNLSIKQADPNWKDVAEKKNAPKTHSSQSEEKQEQKQERQTVEGVDESLENILQELKERGIGNS
ncbi:30S ribosomal protein S1 [Acidimicrobiia bacterium]|jgi:small subunit ribosomal protein S1|nr:30S ribosomal protein S1 [Acidimicrobiia bacterium]MDA8667858.1 30S ribosomal protein S1 [Candidatus Actinomarina sp.]MDA7547777.1 30S ribosomal protein S1 [Acidimicrobiia bacterium]MDA7595081.1 30S ribosomal protein S1 [Acidimicrobiia bacterium]MDA9198157.1 30S ribosomal protein S1 [Acidimicrobiia bacterium]|tara:strand:+ start:8348 stop:9625 length:1278 start_codon:yes stop_codon:yes gene_type:complete